MDFLYLLIIYLLLFIVVSLVLLYRDAAVFCTGPLGSLKHLLAEVIGTVVPSSVQNTLYNIVNTLLYKRTCFFQVIFVVLCLMFHGIAFVDLIPILVRHYPHDNHLFWPIVAVFTNYYFFHKAWITDPGEITHSNIDQYKNIYKYDGMLYTKGSMCSTCNIVKPARSKHCSVCNRCVHRFDHHCIWTNNCVGAYTHRYFIMFMVTLLAMWLRAIYVGAGCLHHYADDIKLFNASYVEDDGTIKPMNMSVAFQHLFMALPRVVFMVVGLSALTVLVLVFLGQHLYLICTNQTTNDTYKVRSVDWKLVARHDNGNTSKKSPNVRKALRRPYSRGIIQNVMEVFLPSYFIQTQNKLKAS